MINLQSSICLAEKSNNGSGGIYTHINVHYHHKDLDLYIFTIPIQEEGLITRNKDEKRINSDIEIISNEYIDG